MRAVGALLVVATLFGCGSDKNEQPAPGAACGNDDALVDGACVATGVPPDRCGAGLRAEARGCVFDAAMCPNAAVGACLMVGITTCAMGFTADGEGSCKPILPAAACTGGTLALPGDAACSEVDACVDDLDGELFVDATAAAGGDGTRARPFQKIGDAVAVASAGAKVAIRDGAYSENLVLPRAIKLVGRCSSKVQLAPADPARAAVHFTGGTSELRGLALTGLVDVGSATVTLASLYFHDVEGLALRTTGGATTTATRVLFDRAKGYAVSLNGGTTKLDDVVVRGTRPLDTGERGIGVSLEQSAKLAATRLVLDGNADTGILVHGSDAVLDRSVVINTQPRTNGTYGVGINALAYSSASAPRGNTLVRDSFVAGNSFAGVFVAGVPLTLERTVVRENKPQPYKLLARGIIVQEHPGSMHRGELTMKSSVVDLNTEVGVAISSSNATIEDSIIRGTKVKRDGTTGVGVFGQVSPGRKDGADVTLRRTLVEGNREVSVYGNGGKVTLEQSIVRKTTPARNAGWGVHVIDDVAAGVAVELSMKESVIEDNVAYGVFAHLADVSIDRCVIRRTTAGTGDYTAAGVVATHSAVTLTGSVVEDNEDTNALFLGSRVTLDGMTLRKPRPRNGTHGVGLVAHVSVDGTPSEVDLRSSLIDGAFSAGMIVGAAKAKVDGLLVRDVLAEEGSGKFGDGIVVRGVSGARGSLELQHSAIVNVKRAAVSVFGSDLSLAKTSLACSAFALDVEPFEDQAPALSDLGGNDCGCGGTAICRALSSSLEPVSIDARTGGLR